MRVYLVTAAPELALDEAQSPGHALRELGCEVRLMGFDLAGVDEPSSAPAPPSVIVLDVRERLETAAGCLKRLREIPSLSTTPALLAVTVDRLAGVDFRAMDDFVLVPVVPAELYARLRQLDWRLSSFRSSEQIKVGDLHVDAAGYEAHVRDRRLDLTHQEFELLKFLVQHPGKVWTREQLLSKVWGHRYAGGTRTVDIHVRRLRAKLAAPTDAMIETVRNVGYKLRV